MKAAGFKALVLLLVALMTGHASRPEYYRATLFRTYPATLVVR